MEETGLSVISDIDDTIKITEVRDRNATLRNTFAREFRPVPGMADFYQRLARERSATFHYISASPWQLYEPMADFVQANKFPAGTFNLKEFRWKNRTALSLFADPEKYKPTVIEPLLKPEIYAALARKFPEQIQRIYIRDVTGEAADSLRYQQTFRGLPGGLWKIFTHPEELELPPALPLR
jgi:phosphatidate phosphatase APP1